MIVRDVAYSVLGCSAFFLLLHRSTGISTTGKVKTGCCVPQWEAAIFLFFLFSFYSTVASGLMDMICVRKKV